MNFQFYGKPKKRILILEDNSIHAEALERAFRDAGSKHALEVCGDGLEGYDHLRTYKNLPELILLDLNLPRMSGLDILKAMKEDGELRRVPVIILTTSSDPMEIKESYDLGAAGFFVKPSFQSEYNSLVANILNYWNLSEVPNG